MHGYKYGDHLYLNENRRLVVQLTISGASKPYFEKCADGADVDVGVGAGVGAGIGTGFVLSGGMGATSLLWISLQSCERYFSSYFLFN